MQHSLSEISLESSAELSNDALRRLVCSVDRIGDVLLDHEARVVRNLHDFNHVIESWLIESAAVKEVSMEPIDGENTSNEDTIVRIQEKLRILKELLK